MGATNTTSQALGLCQIALTPASPVTGPHASAVRTVCSAIALCGGCLGIRSCSMFTVGGRGGRRRPAGGQQQLLSSTHLPQTFLLEIWIFHVPVETAGLQTVVYFSRIPLRRDVAGGGLQRVGMTHCNGHVPLACVSARNTHREGRDIHTQQASSGAQASRTNHFNH